LPVIRKRRIETLQFFDQFLCLTRRLCYLVAIAGNDPLRAGWPQQGMKTLHRYDA
jgi:hypothetical protein